MAPDLGCAGSLVGDALAGPEKDNKLPNEVIRGLDLGPSNKGGHHG
jgi:hypothetical protein